MPRPPSRRYKPQSNRNVHQTFRITKKQQAPTPEPPRFAIAFLQHGLRKRTVLNGQLRLPDHPSRYPWNTCFRAPKNWDLAPQAPEATRRNEQQACKPAPFQRKKTISVFGKTALLKGGLRPSAFGKYELGAPESDQAITCSRKQRRPAIPRETEPRRPEDAGTVRCLLAPDLRELGVGSAGQARQDRVVDLILAECSLILFEAKPSQPTSDFHGGATVRLVLHDPP
jgi:hypothetical protein